MLTPAYAEIPQGVDEGIRRDGKLFGVNVSDEKSYFCYGNSLCLPRQGLRQRKD